MDKEELKELIKSYLKENLHVKISEDSDRRDYTASIRLVVELDGEEICYSYVDIKHPQPRLRFG